MEADEISGTEGYGYGIKYDIFSSEKGQNFREDDEDRNENDDEDRKDDDEVRCGEAQHLSKCWAKFCRRLGAEKIKPFVGTCFVIICKNMRGKYETHQYVDHCHAVFGYQLYGGMELIKMKERKELPEDMPDLIAKFIYLFNNTSFCAIPKGSDDSSEEDASYSEEDFTDKKVVDEKIADEKSADEKADTEKKNN